nr:MAG TPA: hypothetical protein [Caudoviricetes sp.]
MMLLLRLQWLFHSKWIQAFSLPCFLFGCVAVFLFRNLTIHTS